MVDPKVLNLYHVPKIKNAQFYLAIDFYFTFHNLIQSTTRYFLVTFHLSEDFNFFPVEIPCPSLLLLLSPPTPQNPIEMKKKKSQRIKTIVCEPEHLGLIPNATTSKYIWLGELANLPGTSFPVRKSGLVTSTPNA